MSITREYFESLRRKVLEWRKPGEHFFGSVAGEKSLFVRINASKIRQTGLVEDAVLDLKLVIESPSGELRQASRSLQLTGLSWQDDQELKATLEDLRREVPQLPPDPYAKLPSGTGALVTETRGEILGVEDAADALLGPIQGVDLAGIYAAGPAIRAIFDSAGTSHWCATETFSLDYSVYTPNQRALKGTFAGTRWNSAAYQAEIESAKERVAVLERPARRIERGMYRTYLAPAAVADLVGMFSWGAISEAAIRQGDSPLIRIREQGLRFSPLFSLSEDFRSGLVPRFNDLGELAPEELSLISEGHLKNTLVSTRTSKEYGVASNGASQNEGLRAARVAPGSLREEDILSRLGTGLYLSNLHYLNWSDQAAGRVTGMTRYACFWVENGKIVAPIENMRWDDSLYSLFGDALEAVTARVVIEPDVGSYGFRGLGGVQVPGMLLSRMAFTL